MRYRGPLGAATFAAALVLTAQGAVAFDDAQYPNFKGQWLRIGSPNWRPTAGAPPLTPEYQKIFDANTADQKAGGPGDWPSTFCIPQGMPAMMNVYDPTEFVVLPDVTYVLVSHVDDSYRRIYTDGRDWPKPGEYELTYAGYSIGKWLDVDGNGKYDVLEVETRLLKGPRGYDASGIPLHHDNQSIIKERIHLDPTDKDTLVNEITVIDHALTRPWSITRTMTRNPKRPVWHSDTCSEDNSIVKVGNEAYYLSSDGFLMPMKKGQQPPDTKYFKLNEPK